MESSNKTKAALATLSSELATLREQQNAARNRIMAINSQINVLRETPVSLKDYMENIAHFVTQRGLKFGRSIDMRALVRPKRGEHDLHVPVYLKSWSQFETEGGEKRDSCFILPDHSSLQDGRDPFGAWCFFSPELVIQKLNALFQQEADGKWVESDAPPV